MVIDDRAYTAIKTVTYLVKKGGVSNTGATARSIGVEDAMLLPIVAELSAHKLIATDGHQPYPTLKLIAKSASAYQIIATVADGTAEPQLIEAVTASNPAQESRWIDVYRRVQTYEGKACKELEGLKLIDLARLYHLIVAAQM